tara:strand:- start:667 stop:1980 length:1314 start_codon:yes stop_codon:yes gene_type:complete
MAETTGYQRTETLPTNMLGQFYAGVPGQNVPGIMPLLNQDLVNKIMGFGVAGANPYTYTGQRIAGFTPAQEEAFRLTAQGVGGYQPFIQGAENMIRSGVGTASDAFGTSTGLIGEAIGAGERSTAEGTRLLRQAPRVAGRATGMGIGQLLGAGRGLGTAADVGYGSTRMFDPSSVESFYNPFEDQVVQQTLKDVREGLAQDDISRRAGAIGSGAFGGSRSRLLGEELAESAARGAAERVGAIRSAGFGDAARRAQSAFETQQARQAGQANLLGRLAGQQAGIGSAIAGLGTNFGNLLGRTAGGIGALGGNLANIYGRGARDIQTGGQNLGQLGLGAGSQLAGLGALSSSLAGTDITRLLGMGGMQQGLDQRGLDLAFGNFVGQYNLPMQTIAGAANLASGLAPSMGGTTVQQTSTGNDTNPLMQALGTASTLYGAFK